MTESWLLFEIISMSVMGLILLGDLLLVLKRPHIPSMKETSLWVVFYVTLALVFAGIILLLFGPERSLEFTTGWIIEYSLSIDNLFVFILIMNRFTVPKAYQQYVLMIGIILALIFRGVFIVVGVQLISHLSWVFYIFGVFLLYTAVQQAFGSEDSGEAQNDNAFVRGLKKRVNFTEEYNGTRFKKTIDGKKYFTPMLIVLIAIGTTDVMFALDSIPAIFGITQDPFIVFSANVFALMGLRQLYFLLGGLLDRMEYLKYGIAAILAFIGFKLIVHAMHENQLPFLNNGEPITFVPEISTTLSLLVIVGCLAVTIIASIIKSKISARSQN